jgi:3-methylfumaryl-CoA hydratase
MAVILCSNEGESFGGSSIMSQTLNLEEMREWIGRTESAEETLAPFPVHGLSALLDRATAPSEIPPLWHWLYFKPTVAQAELDLDGHPKRGGFLPPISLPRRMWAGSRIRFLAPLDINARVRRETIIRDIALKKGRQGDFVLLSLEHRLQSGNETAIQECQDIVYRPLALPAADKRATALREAGAAELRAQWQPDAVQLFRYSALTFNAHRIHYDRRYAEEVEGYPDLIVQGPFMATVLLERFVQHIGEPLAEFSFRALSPLFVDQVVELGCRRQALGVFEMWAASNDGRVRMTATARTFAGTSP